MCGDEGSHFLHRAVRVVSQYPFLNVLLKEVPFIGIIIKVGQPCSHGFAINSGVSWCNMKEAAQWEARAKAIRAKHPSSASLHKPSQEETVDSSIDSNNVGERQEKTEKGGK